MYFMCTKPEARSLLSRSDISELFNKLGFWHTASSLPKTTVNNTSRDIK